MCVASSDAEAARGDAAQAAFDRKLSHYRDEIFELRDQGIHYRPLIWTADGRPHPAVTRTLQYAADIASSQNGQQMSAKSLQRRWKHEIQIAFLRQRAAMTRAVLPNPSARASLASQYFESLQPSISNRLVLPSRGSLLPPCDDFSG